MKKIIRAGATDQTIDVFIQDSASTTGGGKTGLAYNTASLVCYYRKGATGSATALALATQTVGGAHSDGGFVEIDATNMPGLYRLDLSDTIVASAGSVSLMLKGASGMAPLPIELQVVAVNLEDSVRMGLTALPNAAADAAGGLPISDAGGLDLDAQRSDVAAILVDTGTTLDARIPAALVGGRMDVSVGAMAADVLTSSALAASAVTEIQSGLSTLDAAGVRTAVGLASANLDTQLATIDTVVDAILVDTGTEIPASISTLTGYVDTEVAAIKAKTDNLPTDPADASDIAALAGAISTTLGTPAGASVSADIAAVKAQTAAIETDTQDIQGRIPAALTGAGNMKSDALALNGDTTAASNIAKTTRAIARGTVTTGGSTTSIPTSAFSPAGAAADQFKGRIVTFDADTATLALRGQSTDITASSNSATPTLTVTALTTAPASGDTFSIT